MKFKMYMLVSMLAVLCLICSCANGGGSEGDAQKTVTLTLAVNTDGAASNVITVGNPNITGLTYQYKANALFESEFGTPQGTKTSWTDFTVTNGTGSVGDFAQGRWEFEVRVIKKGNNYAENNTATYTLMYQTAEAYPTYLNAAIAANPIEITVVRQIDKANNAKGTLSIASITAPTASESDKLVVTYGPVGGAQSGTTTIVATSRSGADPYTTTFTSDYPMDPGLYWVTFTYNDGSANVGATTKYVEIIKNLPTTVSGALDANKWLATSLTIKGVKTITCEASTTAEEFIKGANVAISIDADIKENNVSTGEAIKYYFCDGNSAPVDITANVDEGVYSWNTTNVAKGNYYINIIASDATGKLATGAETPLKITIK